MLSVMPRQWSKFLGQPYLTPGTVPNKFFMERVTPAQWWVFSLGMDTSRSAPSTVWGKKIRPSPVRLVGRGRGVMASRLRSTYASRSWRSAWPMPDSSSSISVSRRWPGPSATMTWRAPTW